MASPEVAAGGGLCSQPGVDLEQVRAAVVVGGASWPASPASSSSSSACVRCHRGSAISDTHPEPGGVASACRTHRRPLTTQHLEITGHRQGAACSHLIVFYTEPWDVEAF